MDIEHDAFTLQIGGLVPRPEIAFAALGDDGAAILDVGSGTGKWAIAVANLFPTTTVVGIDLTPARFNGYVSFSLKRYSYL